MQILIPTAINQTVPARVLAGIDAQTEPCTVTVIATPGVIDSQRNQSLQRLRGEARSRNTCSMYAEALDNDDYVCTMDRDIVLPPSAIADMRAELDADPKLGAVSIRVENGPGHDHVTIQCTVWLWRALIIVRWIDQPIGCHCLHATAELQKLGYDHRYSTTQPAMEVIDGE